MDKIHININGKTFNVEGKNLTDIVNQFLTDAIGDIEQNYNDIPKPYNNYKEYLGLADLNVATCSSKELYDDLKKKLNNRLDWIKRHPNANLNEVESNLKIIYNTSKELVKKLDYLKSAYEAVQLYYVDVNNKLNKTNNEN